jgi:hypothetical protein
MRYKIEIVNPVMEPKLSCFEATNRSVALYAPATIRIIGFSFGLYTRIASGCYLRLVLWKREDKGEEGEKGERAKWRE